MVDLSKDNYIISREMEIAEIYNALIDNNMDILLRNNDATLTKLFQEIDQYLIEKYNITKEQYDDLYHIFEWCMENGRINIFIDGNMVECFAVDTWEFIAASLFRASGRTFILPSGEIFLFIQDSVS